MSLQSEHLAKYCEDYQRTGISTWIHWIDIQILDYLNCSSLNKTGGITEIGVHHGGYYMLLNSIVEPHFGSFAVDVFDDQHLNIDKSGAGHLETFKKALDLCDRHRGMNTTIIHGDSFDPALRLRDTIGYGTMRFVSVDGGHEKEHVMNDLQIAEDILAKDGIVVLDDIFNFVWSGVTEGVYTYLRENRSLLPFAVTNRLGGKMYMCKPSYQKHYFDYMRVSPFEKVPEFKGHPHKFFGYDVNIIGIV